MIALPLNAIIRTINRIPATGQPPLSRASYGSAYSSTTLAIFGGQDNNQDPLGDLWLFDFKSYLWLQIVSLTDNSPCII